MDSRCFVKSSSFTGAAESYKLLFCNNAIALEEYQNAYDYRGGGISIGSINSENQINIISQIREERDAGPTFLRQGENAGTLTLTIDTATITNKEGTTQVFYEIYPGPQSESFITLTLESELLAAKWDAVVTFQDDENSRNEWNISRMNQGSCLAALNVLCRAQCEGNVELALLAIEKGACRFRFESVNTENWPGGFHCPLVFECENDGNEAVVTKMLEAGYDVNGFAGNETALIVAIDKGLYRLIPVLVRFGASKTMTNKWDYTPYKMMQMCGQGDSEVAQLLKV